MTFFETNSFLTPNNFIPASRSKDQAGAAREGRDIYYKTVLVATPVLASARLNPTDGSPKRLLTQSDLDEVTDLISDLYIGGGSAPNNNRDSGVPIEEEVKKEAEDGDNNADGEEEALGRFEQSIYDAKSKTSKTVLRSVRLTAHHD